MIYLKSKTIYLANLKGVNMNKYKSVNYVFNDSGERLFYECVEREDFTLKRTYKDELSNLKK